MGRFSELDPKLAETAIYLARCVATNRMPAAAPVMESGRSGADLPTGDAVANPAADAPSLDDWRRALSATELNSSSAHSPS